VAHTGRMADAQTWEIRLREWRASGLTAREFCASRGFTPGAMYWWSSQLGKTAEAEPRKPMQLARVIRRPSVVAESKVDAGGEPPLVMVEVDGVRLFVTSGVERATLVTVFEALDARARRAAR
jgi:transposase